MDKFCLASVSQTSSPDQWIVLRSATQCALYSKWSYFHDIHTKYKIHKMAGSEHYKW